MAKIADDNLRLTLLQSAWDVELVECGLPRQILFAVSQRLRVSEEALGDEQTGALYVYKKVMSARAILERVEALAARTTRG